MGVDGIKVAEQNHIPVGIRRMQVGQNLPGHPLCPAIGIGCRLLAFSSVMGISGQDCHRLVADEER